MTAVKTDDDGVDALRADGGREIAELDLNPLLCTVDGLGAVDARIRVGAPSSHRDPLLRQLRGPTAQSKGSSHDN